jgi:hypothetical protein
MIENNNLIFFKKSYSQDGEDVVLASFFDNQPGYIGFYVDVGALHPLRFSNTQLFYERGWRGINIDATPGSMEEFRIYRPEDINLEIGVSTDGGDLTFYIFEEPAMNSFDKNLSENRINEGWKLLAQKKVKTISLNVILAENLSIDRKIDFMNIDIEGLDFEVIKSLDLNKFKPEFILLENLDLKYKDILRIEADEICKYLRGRNYIVIAKTLRTLIFKRENVMVPQTEQFSLSDKKFSRAVDILANEYAQKKTMEVGECIDKEGKMIPWYTYPAIEYIKQFDFSGKRIFEFGSGNSTFFWSGIASEVVSVEDNEDWFKSMLALRRKNMKLLYKNVGDGYSESLMEEEGYFDVVIVDGKERDKCCESALKKIKENGLIILDNSERASKSEEYRNAVELLKEAGLIQVDFCGFGPINDYTWATSFFFTRDFDFKSKNHPIQPINIIGQI